VYLLGFWSYKQQNQTSPSEAEEVLIRKFQATKLEAEPQTDQAEDSARYMAA
jgi:hypothetical protein